MVLRNIYLYLLKLATMSYKNTSVTFKNEAMHEATVKQAEHNGDRNRSAYIERLVRADIILNGTDEIKKLIGLINEPA